MEADDALYIDKGPEWWAGWALAFYQWYSDRSFMEILSVTTLDEIMDMYPTCHEMDIMQFVDRMQSHMENARPHARPKQRWDEYGMSQEGLAEEAGVANR